MNTQTNSTADKSNVTASITYYALFCTYRRRKVFKYAEIAERFTGLVNICLEEMECELLDIAVNADHIYISIIANPSMSPMSIFFSLRNRTSTILRSEFEELSKTSALWGKGLYVSTNEIDAAAYEKFLLEQKRKPDKKPSKEESL